MVMQTSKKTTWGGKRPGAGRPETGRTRRSIHLSDDEYEKVKVFISQLRNKKSE